MNGWHDQVQCYILKLNDQIVGLALTGQYGTEAGNYCTTMKDDLASKTAKMLIAETMITFLDREEYRLSFHLVPEDSDLLKAFIARPMLVVYTNEGVHNVGFQILDPAVNPKEKQDWTHLVSFKP